MKSIELARIGDRTREKERRAARGIEFFFFLSFGDARSLEELDKRFDGRKEALSPSGFPPPLFFPHSSSSPKPFDLLPPNPSQKSQAQRATASALAAQNAHQLGVHVRFTWGQEFLPELKYKFKNESMKPLQHLHTN